MFVYPLGETMSQSQPPPGPQYPPQPPPGYYPPQLPPPKKKNTLRNVLLGIIAISLLFIAGCLALVGMAANEVGKSIDESIQNDKEPGGADNPLTIQPGEAFEVRGFDYAAGWRVGRDTFGDVDIKRLRVTNNRDERDSALVEIKFWRGNEVLALADCTTEPIATGTTVTLGCTSVDRLPRNYDKVTINDTF